MKVQRIAIIGSGGAGKSTLARQLGDILGIEIVHLDRLFWHPGWVETPRDQWLAVQEEEVRRERWIIDGNYLGTMDVRLASADTVIFLDLPRILCVFRAFKRAVGHWGRSRPDMGEGCPEKVDWEFLRWIWGFPAKTRPEILRLAGLPDGVQVTQLRSSRAVDRFLRGLRQIA
ncbi:MAG: DNA topology modulation protein [Symbiobacteriia bacterium]